jgi:ComF family protein
MPSASQRCGACLVSPPRFDRTHALWPYAYPVDRLVQAYKFHARLQLAPWFGRRLAPAVPRGAVLVAIPLHHERLRERGFNQAHELARHIARLCGLQSVTRGIRRVRATAEQSRTRHEARAANVRNVFACDVDLAGKAVVAIDDVMTTGATLDEFAATLKRAGAATVTNVVIARTLL